MVAQTSVTAPPQQLTSRPRASESSTPTPPQSVAPPAQSTGFGKSLAQLYLIKGPIVSNPPQIFSGEFLPTGKAQVILSGRRLLTGDFELFHIGDSIKAKYKPALVNPDVLKPSAGADAKGFAALNDGGSTHLECVYSLTKATGRSEGICADNQRNSVDWSLITKEHIERRMDELAREYGRTPRGDPRREEIANELSSLCLRLDQLLN